jgi:hypothetical protein
VDRLETKKPERFSRYGCVVCPGLRQQWSSRLHRDVADRVWQAHERVTDFVVYVHLRFLSVLGLPQKPVEHVPEK